MAINRESNTYTVIFAIVMVVVVGGLLAFTWETFKGTIKANQTNEKKQNILQAIGIEETQDNDSTGFKYTREMASADFNKYITRRITLNYNGDVLSDLGSEDAIDPKNPLDAFNIDLRKEYKLYGKKIIKETKGNEKMAAMRFGSEDNIHYPMFVCEKDGKTYYVVPAVGTGLWDDVWGYIGLQGNCDTINGAVFDHKGETPGLGSKIAETYWEEQFKGKRIKNDQGGWENIEVIKPGNEKTVHQVDGISGATFTGVGVGDMLERAFVVYTKFFDANPEFVKN